MRIKAMSDAPAHVTGLTPDRGSGFDDGGKTPVDAPSSIEKRTLLLYGDVDDGGADGDRLVAPGGAAAGPLAVQAPSGGAARAVSPT